MTPRAPKGFTYEPCHGCGGYSIRPKDQVCDRCRGALERDQFSPKALEESDLKHNEVIKLLHAELGITPFSKQVHFKGGGLLFYEIGQHNVIVQVFEAGGFDVYANGGQNDTEQVIAWLKKMKDTNAPTQCRDQP